MARILVIEDDEQVREVLRKMLEGAGYDVEDAPDGVEGVQTYKEDPADLVITDLIMPEKDGVETIRELQRDYPDVKVIAITGVRGSFSRIPAADNLGAKRIFVKPFSSKEMLEAVEEVLSDSP